MTPTAGIEIAASAGKGFYANLPKDGSLAVEVDCVSLSFKVNRDGVNTLKEAVLHLFRQRRPDNLFWALREVSFTLNQGERLGVIGRNGSGKTTLLSLLAGIYPPDHGRVVTRGRVVGLLGLGAGFDPEISGRENIFLNASLFGISARQISGRLEEIIAFADVGEFIEMPVKTYSSGMTARIGFAVAAHLDADIILLDEVLAVGDAQFREKCMQRMACLREEGRTMVLVSHDMPSVREMCHRVIWLERGQIAAAGMAEEVISAYQAKFGTK